MTSTDIADDPSAEKSSVPGRGGLVATLGLAAVAVTASALAGIGYQLSGGGTQPHDVLPADTIAYARIDLDPSAGQKVAAFRLVKKFPELAKSLGIEDPDQDLRRLIVDQAASGCGLDFADDIKPWIGERAGVAVVGTAPDVVFALQVDDETAARKTLKQLADCGDADNAGLAFSHGYAIVAETQAIADETVADADRSALADDSTFSRDMDDLGNQGVASFWVDGNAVANLASVRKELPQPLLSALPDSSTAAAALRAGSSSVELDVVSRGLPFATTEDTQIETLPASTVAAVALQGSEDQIRSQWTQFIDDMEADGVDSDQVGRFVDALGMKLPDDLVALLSPGLTLAVGERNIGTVAQIEDVSDIDAYDIGARVADPDAKDAADRLARLLRNLAGVSFDATTADGATLIANHPDALQTSGTRLSESQRYTDVILPDATNALLFADLGTVIDALLQEDPPPDVVADLEQARPLGTVGISTKRDGDITRAQVKLTFRG
ncbi:DUF3352 domain-containing protein [Aeromicrobium terrae]|uniref:DUF3352 domain-containing protein n=1 Tax=Aeromicrobium terrae TaxID=2498846 RepID=A0A5C8NG37_9ACTN|nr:DUF3352 domain-containing protein [Aeromicrobium terrae]TXL57719.1 DUF3352 domain-containing protein [Aeromicrobium terrae]